MTKTELQRRIRILAAMALVTPLALLVDELMNLSSGKPPTPTLIVVLVLVGIGFDGLCILLILYLKRKIQLISTARTDESQAGQDAARTRKIRIRYRYFILSAAFVPPIAFVLTVLLLSLVSAPVYLDRIIPIMILFEILAVLTTSSMWIFFRDRLQEQGWNW